MIIGGSCLAALYIGASRPLPFGIPMLACISLPCNFWNVFSGTAFFLYVLLISSCNFVCLSVGSCIVYVSPLMIHPRISFFVSQSHSSCFSFFSETGSPPLWFVICGDGKMECIPCSIALDMCFMLSCVLLFVMAMKSSTYISVVFILFADVESDFV